MRQLNIKGTVSQYKHPEVTILKTFSNQLQMDIVRPQVHTRYVGHEQIAIAFRRLGCSYYPEVHEMNPPGLSFFSSE